MTVECVCMVIEFERKQFPDRILHKNTHPCLSVQAHTGWHIYRSDTRLNLLTNHDASHQHSPR
jgi:hypothetical protein